MLTVITFFTQDWKYPEYAAALAEGCKLLGLAHRIEELPSTGSYLKNTCMKPQFILDKLLELTSPVLWIDCDGSIQNPPTFFYHLEADMAARRMPPARARTWHVGTMWFNYTPQMIEFLNRWIDNTGAISDESALEKTWREMGEKIVCSDIPPEYFRILKPNASPAREDVICHRISTGESKRRELPLAIKRAKAGIL